jgi:hypothetical protein
LNASFKQTLFVLALWWGARTKFIRKLTFVILVFPEYDGCMPSRIFLSPILKKIQALPDILRGKFSKLDHIRPSNEFFKNKNFHKTLSSKNFITWSNINQF